MNNNNYKVEKKFFCDNSDDLIYKVLNFNMKLVDISYDIDEYFTDIESEYIKSMTCLRIRRKNSEQMEIMYKGKSNEFLNLYTTKESNIIQDINNYEAIVELLSNLGFYTYVCVEKTRKTYSITRNKVIYNIMIDDIKDLGSFAEFEVLSEDDNISESKLKEKLDNFIKGFSNIKLREATLPYRDFVAKEIYNKNVTRKFNKILVNINDIIKNITKNGVKEAICDNKSILNLKLVQKLMEQKIDVIIMYDGLSEDTLNYINKTINSDNRFTFKDIKELENISLNDTLILKDDDTHKFSNLALVILNWYGSGTNE